MQLIVDSILNPAFLDLVAVLTFSGKDAKILDPADLQKRIVDIIYVRVRCTVHGSSVNSRFIKIVDLSFYFCFQLPQHVYNEGTYAIKLLNDVPGVSTTTSSTVRSLGSCFAASSGSIGVTIPSITAPLSTGRVSPVMTRFSSS